MIVPVSKLHLLNIYCIYGLLASFYLFVVDGVTEPGFEILLDNQRLRTPIGSTFSVPHEGLALAIAHEWDSQKETIKRYSMPLVCIIKIYCCFFNKTFLTNVP